MENSDASNLSRETLEDQYERVKDETNTSTVCQFGDVDNIGKMSVSNFQGMRKKVGTSYSYLDPNVDAVASPDVEKVSLERLMQPDSGLSEEERVRVKRRYRSLIEGKGATRYDVRKFFGFVDPPPCPHLKLPPLLRLLFHEPPPPPMRTSYLKAP